METTNQAAGAAVALQSVPACPTCGENISRQFCPACGEKKFDRSHFAFRHFFRHALQELMDFDSKIFRTVRYLFSRPGYIAQEYLAGKRSRYVNPFKTYLFSFALLLFLYSVYRPVFDLGALANVEKSGVIHRALDKQAKKFHVSEEQYVDRINEHWHFYMELARILNAFIMAGLLAALYYRRHWYFAEHAVTAFYFLSFASLLDVVLWPVYLATGGLASRVKGIVFLVIALPYMWSMLRRVYKDSAGKTAFKTILIYLGTQVGMAVTMVLSLVAAITHTRFSMR